MPTNVSPAHWFLPSLPDSRAPYTSKNLVEPLIDGQSYMEHLHQRLSEMVAGDYLHIAGWQVTPGQKLLGASRNTPNFLEQVKGLMRSDVLVKVMLWMWNLPTDNALFVCGINSLDSRNGEAILDARLPKFSLASVIPGTNISFPVSSHHQKTIILRAAGDHWAYIGGIDIASDRWDTNNHDNSKNRTKVSFDAWHDLHCVIRGRSVGQISENFDRRWNDSTRPNIVQLPPKPMYTISSQDISFYPGTHHVQVLRTLACQSTYTFLPGGEQTIRLAYEKAIDLAQYYIYIEEQYLWPCSVIDKLRDAAGRGVKVVIVVAHQYDIDVLKPWHNQMRFEAIETIKSIRPENVYVYHLQQSVPPHSDIYVHSKVMIVDDCYVILGSANINNRSFTNDSELNIAVVDENTIPSPIGGTNQTVCVFAKDLRIRLWTEHLGVDASSIDDPILAIDTVWPNCSGSTSAAPTKKHHVVCHHVPTQRSTSTTTPIDVRTDLMDPEFQCP